MEKLVAAKTVENIDILSQSEYSIPAALLMEQAGIKGWQQFLQYASTKELSFSHLLFVCGGGNNGGDALVMAREAFNSGLNNLSILLVGSQVSKLSTIHRSIVSKLGIPMSEALESDGTLSQEVLSLIEKSDLIVDGIAGTGLKGPLRGGAVELVKTLNKRGEQGAFLLSIDVPSGCGDTIAVTSSHIKADLTITMGLVKVGAYHPAYRVSWGTILTVNPSFPPKLLKSAESGAYLATERDLSLMRLGEDSYKFSRGHLALFAGSNEYRGAAQLAAKGAFHSRCGVVTHYNDYGAKESDSTIVRTVEKGRVIRSETLQQNYQAIAAGPGWVGEHEEQIIEILRSGLPLVFDAAALDLWAKVVSGNKISKTHHGKMVLTPHPQELNRLLERLNMGLWAQELGARGSVDSFITSLKKVAQELEVVLLYKSYLIWIVDGREKESTPIVVEGLNSALGVAGSGDVLTGIIGSLLAQGLDPKEAALQGVLIHQKGGKLAKEKMGWFDSEALLSYIGLAVELAQEGRG